MHRKSIEAAQQLESTEGDDITERDKESESTMSLQDHRSRERSPCQNSSVNDSFDVTQDQRDSQNNNKYRSNYTEHHKLTNSIALDGKEVSIQNLE